jgi:hypothetical protein
MRREFSKITYQFLNAMLVLQLLTVLATKYNSLHQGSRCEARECTHDFGKTDMEETRRVEQTRTGEKKKDKYRYSNLGR